MPVTTDSGRADKLLDAVLRLTAQPDILTLCSNLHRMVTGMLPDVQLRVYERAASDEWRMAGLGPWGVRLAVRPDQDQHQRDLQRILRLLPQADKVQLDFPPHATEAAGSTVLAIRQGTELLAALVLQGPGIVDRLPRVRPLFAAFSNLYRSLYRASHDKLTGLLNRQTFDDRMEILVEQIASGSGSLGDDGAQRTLYVILDIDHFKQVNDRFGHLMGDEVLLRFARLMMRSFRSEDLLFRFGGEEFVVLLNNVTDEQGMRVLDRFRQAVADTDFPQVGHVSCSIGFAPLDLTQSLEIVSERADKALYYAKAHGRDQVRGFEALLARGELQDDTHASTDVDLF